jgi:hypothetical protein
MRAAVILALLDLTGCATTRYQTVYCVQRDDLPTAEQCANHTAKHPELCEPPKVHSQLTGHADSDIGIIAGSAIRLRAWGEGLQTILEGCREPAK